MKKIKEYLPLFFQLFRYGIVGIIAASVNFIIVVLFVQSQTLHPLQANVVAFMAAFQVSYWGHRLWTFSGTVAEHRTAFPRLLGVQIINLGISEYLYYLFLNMHIHYTLALFFVLAIMPIFTFTVSKLWIFE